MAVRISFWSRLLDLIAPRQCVVCGRRLSVTEEVVCSACNLHLPRTGFHRSPMDNVMARLFWGNLPVERVAALFYYNAGAEATQIVLEMKYHNHPEVGRVMGRMMACEMQPTGFFDGIDMIVPVPLAAKRQRQRGYNQSMELARGLSEVTGLPIFSNIVQRTLFTESQTHLGRWERRENVSQVFQLKDEQSLRGRHVLLVDDVVTTGATVTACGQELLKAEGVKLSVLSLGFAKS